MLSYSVQDVVHVPAGAVMDTVGKMMAVEAQRSSDMAEERASGLTHRRGRDYRIENINPAVFGINTGFSLMTNAQIVKAEELCKASTCRHSTNQAFMCACVWAHYTASQTSGI